MAIYCIGGNAYRPFNRKPYYQKLKPIVKTRDGYGGDAREAIDIDGRDARAASPAMA